MERVVITGAGVVSPIGSNLKEFMAGIQNGIYGTDMIQSFDASCFPSAIGGEVKLDGVARFLSPEIDKSQLFLERAMKELMESRPAIFADYPASNRVLNIGTGLDYFNMPDFINSPGAVEGDWHPFCHHSYRIVEQLASHYQIQGGFQVNVSACVASSQSMGLSYRMLKTDPHRVVITGGVDSMVNHLHYIGFNKLGALSNWTGDPKEACRPFDKDRCGLVLGEGAAVFFFQNLTAARPAEIMAEIAGYGSTMDAYMVTDPRPDGAMLAKAALIAISEAGITPDHIDCVHLHGTGTLKNEPAEAKALELVFGSRYQDIPAFSLKGQVGHLIGACGAIEMLGVIYSLKQQQVPVTVNFKTPDPEAPLHLIQGTPLDMEIRYILKLNAAFGGQNSAFVVKRYEP